MADDSVIKLYVIDFWEHLEKVEKHRKRFLRTYPEWKRVRLDTLEQLEELLKMLQKTEFRCGVGYAVGAATGLSGNLAAAGCALAGSVNPVAISVAAVGHGVKAGFAAGNATCVMRVRDLTSELVQRDFNETSYLVELGLSFDGVLREMRDIVRELQSLTVSRTVQEIKKHLTDGADSLEAGTGPHQLVHYVAQADDRLDETTPEKVRQIISLFTKYNPDIPRAARAAGQFAFDCAGFTRLMRMTVLGTALRFEHMYVVGNIVSASLDLRDLVETIINLKTGGSVNQDQMIKVINRLKDELRWLERVYKGLLENE